MADDDRDPDKQSRPEWIGLAGLGFEIVAAMIGLGALGYWIDRRAGSEPTWLVVGILLGLVGGMANFLRVAIGASRRSTRRREGPGDGGGDRG